jgi:hypothetical protein
MTIKGVELVFNYNKELKIWCGYVVLPNFVEVAGMDYEPHGGITLKEKSGNKKRIYGFDCYHLGDGPKGTKNFKTKEFVKKQLKEWARQIVNFNESKADYVFKTEEVEKKFKKIIALKMPLGITVHNITITDVNGEWIGFVENNKPNLKYAIRKGTVKKNFV